MKLNATNIIFLSLSYIILLITPISESNSTTCYLNAPPGSCEGPVERTIIYRINTNITNLECGLNQIPYKVDNNESSPYVCGECEPGIGGWEDPRRLCKIDEYCDDDGTCKLLKESPFFGMPCPYESGSPIGWCGPGLKCYNHKCLPCLDGMIDYSDGKVCVSNEWTYSRWQAMLRNPSDVLLLLIFIVLLLTLVIPNSRKLVKVIKNEVNKRRKSKKSEQKNSKLDVNC